MHAHKYMHVCTQTQTLQKIYILIPVSIREKDYETFIQLKGSGRAISKKYYIYVVPYFLTPCSYKLYILGASLNNVFFVHLISAISLQVNTTSTVPMCNHLKL